MCLTEKKKGNLLPQTLSVLPLILYVACDWFKYED